MSPVAGVGGGSVSLPDLSAYATTASVTSGLAGKVATDTLTASGLGVCVHGATAGTARPTGYARIMWIGSVTPSNATDNDVWVDTS